MEGARKSQCGERNKPREGDNRAASYVFWPGQHRNGRRKLAWSMTMTSGDLGETRTNRERKKQEQLHPSKLSLRSCLARGPCEKYTGRHRVVTLASFATNHPSLAFVAEQRGRGRTKAAGRHAQRLRDLRCIWTDVILPLIIRPYFPKCRLREREE